MSLPPQVQLWLGIETDTTAVIHLEAGDSEGPADFTPEQARYLAHQLELFANAADPPPDPDPTIPPISEYSGHINIITSGPGEP